MNTNTTNYPLLINTKINNFSENYDENREFLKHFQYIVKEYMINSNNRGLLLYHSPGMGKTVLSSAIADYYRKHDPYRKIIVLLNKSLESNFRQVVKSYMSNNHENSNSEKSKYFIDNTLEDKYTFVSLNSSTMYKQIERIGSKKKLDEFNKALGKLNKELKIETKKKNMLENSLLIIDEFHNFSNSVKNKSKNAIQLYKAIMKTKNIKLLFLTGTPIINTPFEIVPTFNLLKGYIGKNITLFPENYEEFESFFINKRKNKKGNTILKIKNKEQFQNRIFGLTSYYGDFYFDKKDKVNFPEEKPIIIEKIEMSSEQFARYREVRDIEKKENSNSIKKRDKSYKFEIIDKSKNSSSYRIRSRQVSNYFIPEYALMFKNKRMSVTKYISKIKDDDLINLKIHSPKFNKIIDNIKKHPNQLGLVYSEFVAGEGIGIFSKILEKKEGYKLWSSSKYVKNQIGEDVDEFDLESEFITQQDSDSTLQEDSDYVSKGGSKSSKVYAMITGDISVLDRKEILKIYTSPDNKYGKIIQLLIVSKTGAEGLDLKNVRHIHITEPFWNYARIEQIIARGSRFKSHILLKPEEQNIQPYIYLSKHPSNYTGKDYAGELSTDEELWISSLNNKKLIDEFSTAIIETSIDCSIHYDSFKEDIKKKYSCKVCAPNNNLLYNTDIYKDIKIPDPCKKLTTISKKDNKIDVKEIKLKINDEKEETFYYKQDPKNKLNIKLFIFDEDLKGYVPMKKSYPFYGEIIQKILF